MFGLETILLILNLVMLVKLIGESSDKNLPSTLEVFSHAFIISNIHTSQIKHTLKI
jgi:hypothetical protein